MRESQDGLEDSTTVFVGGIPWGCNEEVLRADFARHGEVNLLVLPRDKDGKLKGMAFVTYGTPEGARGALKLDGEEYGGRTLKVNLVPASKGKDGKGKAKTEARAAEATAAAEFKRRQGAETRRAAETKAKKARAAEAKAAAEAKNSEQGSCPAHRSGGSARLDKGWKAYCAHQGMALRRISRASSDEHFARVATVSMSASVDVAQARILREALDGGDDAFEKKARSIAESARDKKDLDELMELWAKRAGDRSSQELERQDGEAAQRGRDDAEPIQVLGVHHAEDADEAAGAGCAAAIRR